MAILKILTGHLTSKNTLLSRWQPGPVSFERQNELAHEAEKNCQKWRQESVRKPVTKDPSAQKSSHIVTCVAEAFFETASFSTIVSLCFLKEISKSSQTHVSPYSPGIPKLPVLVITLYSTVEN